MFPPKSAFCVKLMMTTTTMIEQKSWTFLCFFLLLLVGECLSSEAERRLLDDLLVNYQKFERPVADETEPVNLELSLSLQQVNLKPTNCRW